MQKVVGFSDCNKIVVKRSDGKLGLSKTDSSRVCNATPDDGQGDFYMWRLQLQLQLPQIDRLTSGMPPLLCGAKSGQAGYPHLEP